MRWEPYIIRQNVATINATAGSGSTPKIEPRTVARITFFAAENQSGGIINPTQLGITDIVGFHQITAGVSVGNANATSLLCDLWLREGEQLTVKWTNGVAAGFFTIIASGYLYIYEDEKAGPNEFPAGQLDAA